MTRRVLVVDDEVNMRWVLKEALTEAGYDVAVAGNGHEALSQMTQQPADLIILDLKMKGMDGLGTLARLRERWPDVVVIILTAYGTVTTAVEAMQLGAADSEFEFHPANSACFFNAAVIACSRMRET